MVNSNKTIALQPSRVLEKSRAVCGGVFFSTVKTDPNQGTALLPVANAGYCLSLVRNTEFASSKTIIITPYSYLP